MKHSLRRCALVPLVWCISACGQPVSGQPLSNEPEQWKQSIERPSRGWDYDGKRILGHVGYDIVLWDATSGKLLHKMKGHKERIHAVQFSPDGSHALSSSWMNPGGINAKSRDTRVILWNLGTGRERDSLQGQVAGEFSPDGRRIVTFSQRPAERDEDLGKITLPSTREVWQRGPVAPFDAAVWETYTGRQLVKATFDQNVFPGRSDLLHFSRDGSRFVYVGFNVIFNASDGREIGRLNARIAHSLRYTSNGASASIDAEQIRLTDIESGQAIQSIQHGLKTYSRAAWTHDGNRVAVIPYDESEIKIWDIKTGEMTTGAKNGPYPQRTAIISPDNSRLAVEWGGANDIEPGLGIYDTNTGKEIARIKLAEWGHMLGFSPDSKALLVGGSEFVIYNSENGKEVRRLNLLDGVDSHDWK